MIFGGGWKNWQYYKEGKEEKEKDSLGWKLSV
jgi:hypothetical protein